MHKGVLYKTVGFGQPKYVGDPINAVRIFNEKAVDELIIIDIDASRLKLEPNYRLIKSIAVECRMPLCYGGGIKTIDQIDRIISLGIEKVAVSSVIIESPNLIFEAALRLGSQSIVVVIDAKKTDLGNKYEVMSCNGTKATGLEPAQWAKQLENLGVGEIVLNSIDCDGKMNGYDFNLIDQVRNAIGIPLTVLGGAGSIQDIRQLINRYGVIGSAAGSLFVFKGKYRAVLINYPNQNEKELIFT